MRLKGFGENDFVSFCACWHAALIFVLSGPVYCDSCSCSLPWGGKIKRSRQSVFAWG